MPDSEPAARAEISFAEWSAEALRAVEIALEEALPASSEVPARLHEAMRYAVLKGGKRVRPLLVLAASGLGARNGAALMHAAVAVELIHAYSLVHDDLPSMDDDVLRRGKPTVHVAYDEATALLVGDALQCLAFEVLARCPSTPEQVVGLISILARASGSAGMAGGQAIDLESIGRRLSRDELEAMHRAKTGALLSASVMMGATLVEGMPGEQMDALSEYARAIGLAFQVVDDILDVEIDSATLGKTAGKDAEHNKPTYVSILGLAASKELARELHSSALESLLAFGPGAQRLAELANLIVLRKS